MLPTFRAAEHSNVHPLDVGDTLKQYLKAPFRQSKYLFAIFHGKNKGMRASARSIAAWIVQSIQWAYRAKGLAPLEAETAHKHYLNIVGSLTIRHSVTPEVICRATSWSSINTFMSHYCVE